MTGTRAMGAPAAIPRRKLSVTDFHRMGEAGILLIEVADTTMAYDRDVKVPLYAQHGIPEVWLLDAQGGSPSIHRDPSPQGFQRILTHGKNEKISLAMLPDVTIELATILR